MPVTTTVGIPESIQAGSTNRFSLPITGYSTGWTAVFFLSMNGAAITSVAAAAAFIVTIPATTVLLPGLYFYYIVLTETATGEKFVYSSGQIFVKYDPLTTLTSTALTALTAITAAISSGATAYSSGDFNGQSVNFRSLTEMLDARDRLQQIVNAELGGAGLANAAGRKKIVTRFC